MSIYFISDTHFNHERIILYSKRPFSSVEEMDEQLIKNWNAIVKPEDTIWHLGDFAFCKYSKFKNLLARLNGNINVILGNHDRVITDNWNELLDTNLLQSIQYYREIKYNGQMIVLLHYGMRVWNKSHHGSIHLYGHSHSTLPPHGKSVDVGVDCKEITAEYRPVSLDEVIEYMKNREGEVIDHHGRD